MTQPQPLLLAVDIGGTKIAVATYEPDMTDGEPVDAVRRQLPDGADAGVALEIISELAATLLAQTPGRAVSSIGVSCPGVVANGRLSHAPNVDGLTEVDLDQELRIRLGAARVQLAQDVKLAAAAEVRWGLLHGVDPGLYINLGTGLAAAIVIGGRVVMGAHSASGEFGYNATSSSQRRGVSSGTAPLEDTAGGLSISKQASVLLGTPTSTREAFQAGGETPVGALVETALDQLGMHIANAATLLDPQRIVLGGGMLGAETRILPALRRWLEEIVPYPPELRVSQFPGDAPLRGAALLASQRDLPGADPRTVPGPREHERSEQRV